MRAPPPPPPPPLPVRASARASRGYVCRRCSQRPPLPLATGVGRQMVCGHCGSLMVRRSLLPAVGTLLMGGGLIGLSLLALPDALQGLAIMASGTPGLSQVVAYLDPPPPPAQRPLALLNGDLMDRLAEGDQSWIPTAEEVPGQGIRYHYRRRLGEAPLSIAEIQARMADPPTFAEERRSLLALLQELQRVGVALEVAPTRKQGAAGEWDHAERMIRLQPLVVQKGSEEFLRVLNHEAIHVAQSCAGGGLRARPVPLGLPTAMNAELAEQLNAVLYKGAPPLEQQLEREAYANQNRFGLGAELVRQHCPPHPALSAARPESTLS
ncbi:MAG: hypothetical protein VKK43_04885 [Synechococcaceae cyanobacterium]|nr:hypothetical protein [Synechococcaceae cyanobacterium]